MSDQTGEARPARLGVGMLLGLVLLMGTTGAQAQQGAVRGVHDPCILEADGVYSLFCTGTGIPIRRSEDLFHWEPAGRVFDEAPAWFAREVPGARRIWAPDISQVDGEYRLYYSVSTFGSNHSCIGLATNRALDPADPDYAWVDRGPVVRSTRRDDFNAIDPNAILDAVGRPWLAFGSYWSGLKLTRLDALGRRPVDPGDRIALAARPPSDAIEAPFLVHRDGSYYLFASIDQCCQGVRSTYRVVVGRSPTLAGPYRDRAGRSLQEGGGTVILEGHGRVRGPGHCAVLNTKGRDWLVHHYYDAEFRGVPTLQVRPLSWDDDGFPVVGEPIAGPVPAAPTAGDGR